MSVLAELVNNRELASLILLAAWRILDQPVVVVMSMSRSGTLP